MHVYIYILHLESVYDHHVNALKPRDTGNEEKKPKNTGVSRSFREEKD